MNNININKNSTQCGRSMIEMLGVLAIVGVLSVGGIAGYSKAMEKFKINKTAEQISHIATNIRNLYAQQTTYKGLTTSTAIDMGVIPSDMASFSTSSVKNQFNGESWVGAALTSYNEDYKYFAIVYEGLSKNACMTLSTMDWGTTYSSGLIALGVGSDRIYSEGWKPSPWDAREPISSNFEENIYNGTLFGTGKLPLNVAKAAQLCNCPNNTCQFVLLYQ